MNRKIASALVITLFLFNMTTLIKPSYATPADIHVYPGESIQAAINSANPWDTIIVHEGTYNENVDVNKTVNLLAEGIVTVNAADPWDHVFQVTASYVNITGFIVTGVIGLYIAGIYLDNVEHCNISNNNASNNLGGIFLDHSNYNTLINNTANSNSWGIYLYYSNYNILDSNTANSNGIGIFLEYYSNNNTLADNMVYGNDYGIQIGESSDNLIFHNNLINNTLNGYDSNPALNDWHHTILLEGNYWSNYTGVDDGSGTGKHSIAGDGIGDTLIPHPGMVIGEYDFYPFISQDRWKRIETATGTGIATFDSDAIALGNIEAVDESELPSVGKPDLYFKHGFFSFLVVDLTPDQTIIVTIEFPSNIPIGSQYWEYNIGWFQMPIEDDDGDNKIIIQITDGGLGDKDGIANGIIVHTGGIGVLKVPPVGGFTMFADGFGILAPWIGIGLAVIISVTTVAFMMRRRKGFAD
ncbi:MAG: right-handed parallel beta-helix repeat-containing protein [archaeon]|nr:right-handed parallel beta-helix repeat-containing protein [archaeon]